MIYDFLQIHNVRSNVNSPRLNDRRNCSSRYRPFSSASKCGDLAPRDSLNCYTQRKDAYNSDTALEYSISGLSWNRDVSLGLSDADQVLQKDGTHQYHGSGRPCGVSTSHDACATGHSSSHPFNDMPLRRGERGMGIFLFSNSHSYSYYFEFIIFGAGKGRGVGWTGLLNVALSWYHLYFWCRLKRTLHFRHLRRYVNIVLQTEGSGIHFFGSMQIKDQRSE